MARALFAGLAAIAMVACFTTPSADERPNYNEDVYSILATKCLRCHGSGAAMPILLDTYSAARAAASRIPHAIDSGEMPPWGVDVSGECGEWLTPEMLTEQERVTLHGWIDLGAPEGRLGQRRVGLV